VSQTRETVIAALMPDEIDYDRVAAQLGPEAVPILTQLIEEGDPMIAPKATYLVARIPSGRTSHAILVAARASEPLVRLAAAAVAPAVGPEAAPELLSALLDDVDVGVRKQALDKASLYRDDEVIGPQLDRMAKNDSEVALRQLAERFRRPA
jgi:hypothetical protein